MGAALVRTLPSGRIFGGHWNYTQLDRMYLAPSEHKIFWEERGYTGEMASRLGRPGPILYAECTLLAHMVGLHLQHYTILH